MTRKEELEKQLSLLNAEYHQISQEEKYQEHKPLEKRFFKYQYHYGSDDDGKTSWIYTAITKIRKDGTLQCLTFETNPFGIVEFKLKDTHHRLYEPNTEITAEEFIKEFNLAIELVADSLTEIKMEKK